MTRTASRGAARSARRTRRARPSAPRVSRSRSRSRSPTAGRSVAALTNAAETLTHANRFSALNSVLEAGEIDEAEREADAALAAAAATPLPDTDPLDGVPIAALAAATVSPDAHMTDALTDLR